MKKFLAALLGLLIAAPAAAQTLIYNASSGAGTITFPVTVSGATSGGIPCFTASTTMASSNVLGANQVVVGGGVGVCPTSSANFISDSLGTVTTQGLTTTSPGFYAQTTGDAFPRVRVGLNVTDVASISFGAGSGARDLFLERAGAANERHGQADAAAPVAQIISVQNVVAGTSNTAGAVLTIAGSRGTGTGVPGGIILQTAPAGSTGSTQNALVNRLLLDVDAANTLVLRNGANAQTARVYGTFTDASNGDWLSLTKAAGGAATIATVANGTGTAGSISLTAGTQAFNFSSANGQLTGPSGFTAAAASFFGWTSRSHIYSPSDGVITVYNNAESGFTRLQLGGTTASFGSIAASGAIVQARLADASAYAPFEANTVRTATAYTVGTLPTGAAGMRAYVTDQLTSCVAAGLALTGGGAVVCPAFYNGSAWVGD